MSDVTDKQYAETAERVYGEGDKIIFERNPKIETHAGKGGAWVAAKVWVNDEWVEDES